MLLFLLPSCIPRGYLMFGWIHVMILGICRPTHPYQEVPPQTQPCTHNFYIKLKVIGALLLPNPSMYTIFVAQPTDVPFLSAAGEIFNICYLKTPIFDKTDSLMYAVSKSRPTHERTFKFSNPPLLDYQ